MTAKPAHLIIHNVNGEPGNARPVSRLERIWRWCRRNPGIAVPSAVAVVLAVALMLGGPIAAAPGNTRIRDACLRALYGLATCEIDSAIIDAQGHFQQIVDLSAVGNPTGTSKVLGMLSLARTGKLEEASRQAQQIAEKGGANASTLYRQACTLAVCAWSAQQKGDDDAFKSCAQMRQNGFVSCGIVCK